MARLRLYALATVGGFFLVYELLTQAMSPQGPSLSDLVDPHRTSPCTHVGAWLTWRLPTHPQPIRLLVAGTALIAGGAFGSLMTSQPQLINSPWFPVLITLSLEIGSGRDSRHGTSHWRYPDGVVERAWQRLALRCCSWFVLLAAPLALLASPVTPMSAWVAERRRCP